jgi:(R,R)-butanediol dehydrogenase/meso-butanediol dehydrogenase/diacetyl reductase
MHAAVLQALGKPLEIREVPDPKPGPSDLVLRVRSCGICGSDLHAASLPPGLPAGSVMGHEFAGEVVEVGRSAAAQFEIGERVCALPYTACGRCAACLTGEGIRCAQMVSTGLGAAPGAYAEFVKVGAAETLRLPEAVSFREGALVEPLSVGLHAVHEARLEPGANVLVIGAGPIGLSVAVWARFFGARTLMVSEKAAGRRALAERFGATHVIDPTHEMPGVAFAKAAGGPPDVIFECVGVPGMIQQCVLLAPPRGRIVVVGVCAQPDTLFPVFAIVKELTLRFVVGYRKQDFRLTLDMLASERIAGAAMVTDSVDLAALPAAFEALKQPTTQCKVMLELG